MDRFSTFQRRKPSIVPKLRCDDYFTPEARKLCARVKHKSELTDDEILMLALAAAQAALARYWHPGVRSAEDTLETIGAILDHEDVVGALTRKIELDGRQKLLLKQRLEPGRTEHTGDGKCDPHPIPSLDRES